jgi:16S rRNA (guanine966-N2)-methyltransferase
MRISGGTWCGRKLKAPPGDAVRPTQDRVREAIFSMLMNVTTDSTFLDLYAGSGAIGLEALSRGAARATWVEKETRHVAVLKENLAMLGAEAGEVVCSDVMRWVKGPGRGRAFDVIYADPPYELAREHGFLELMTALAEQQVIAKRGFFIAEMAVRQDAEIVPGWTILRDRTYGHTRVVLYRKDDLTLCIE